jgi:hypothetical protein
MQGPQAPVRDFIDATGGAYTWQEQRYSCAAAHSACGIMRAARAARLRRFWAVELLCRKSLLVAASDWWDRSRTARDP